MRIAIERFYKEKAFEVLLDYGRRYERVYVDENDALIIAEAKGIDVYSGAMELVALKIAEDRADGQE